VAPPEFKLQKAPKLGGLELFSIYYQ